jgi:glycogen operon protein
MASINFVTAHDGFTLRDLVSYNSKHNEANKENSRDGESSNRSWNAGIEGETDDPTVNELRRRQRRNMLATLFMSQGVPMLLGGDEFGRTQLGNNNAYCQDNGISWFDWSLLEDQAEQDMLEFTRRLIAFRLRHPVFRRRRWFHGRPIRGIEDIGWFRPDGSAMTDEDWDSGFAKSVAVFLNGDAIITPDDRGRKIRDDSFLLFFNAHHEPLRFSLPRGLGEPWQVIIDSGRQAAEEFERLATGDYVDVEARALVAMMRVR